MNFQTGNEKKSISFAAGKNEVCVRRSFSAAGPAARAGRAAPGRPATCRTDSRRADRRETPEREDVPPE